MKYVVAPAINAQRLIVVNFERIVNEIGSRQLGRGSNSAKGIRYLRSTLNCSGTEIKRLYKAVWKIRRNNYLNFGIYVFKYTENCDKILKALIDWIAELNTNSDLYKSIGLDNCYNKNDYFQWLFSQQYVLLGWVKDTNYQNQRELATLIYNSLPSR